MLIPPRWTAPRSRPADPTKTADAVQRTVKLITTTSENTAEYILVTPPEGGAPIKLLLTGEARKKYSSLFMLRGELIDVTVKPGGQATDMVTAVAKFDGPRELKSPKAFVYDGMNEQKVGQQMMTLVKLSRFGESREAAIPNRPVASGKPAPDPALLE